jgi:hypothetical protein
MTACGCRPGLAHHEYRNGDCCHHSLRAVRMFGLTDGEKFENSFPWQSDTIVNLFLYSRFTTSFSKSGIEIENFLILENKNALTL